MSMIDWANVDIRAWPVLRYGERSVVLARGQHYVCVSSDPRLPNSVTLEGVGRCDHVHLMTREGIAQLAYLMDSDDLRRLAGTPVRGAIEKRDPERVSWRKDTARLRRIHAEGNG